LKHESYAVERFFTETFGGEQCDVMISRIGDLKQEIRKVGEDLGSYSRFSFFRRKDYDYLKRKYFLLQLQFLSTIQKLNNECEKPYLSILFFYEIDQDASERQGFMLQELSKEYEQELIVLSLDKDYKDEPLVNLLVENYGITEAPTLIIDGKPNTGLMFTGELNATIQKFLNRADRYASKIDFDYVPRAAGVDVSRLKIQMELIEEDETEDPWARGDATLIIGRLSRNETRICESLQYYDQIEGNSEEMALKFETIASLGCGRNSKTFLNAAAREWEKVGNSYRAELLKKLALGKRRRMRFDEQAIGANETVIGGYTTPIVSKLKPINATTVIIGNTSIELEKSSKIATQTDRVHRDWLGGQMKNPFGPEILVTFSERLSYNFSELRPDIGWHEGGRLRDLKKLEIEHVPAVGTLVAKHGDKWYAIDDQNTFRFEVPLDKLHYPTTRFLRRDLAVIIDTHGVNMIVEQAIRNNVSAVLSDCDHPGKVYAAKYLSEKGIKVICYPDKYVYLALGHDLDLVGSAPLKIANNKAIHGRRPIQLKIDEKIVVVNATADKYALWYYQTPASYMQELSKAIPLQLTYVELNDFGQMNKVTDKAREISATVLATRVFNNNDYDEVKKWLDEDQERKVILFHSASYPYGQKLFREYSRVTFDDPNPIFR